MGIFIFFFYCSFGEKRSFCASPRETRRLPVALGFPENFSRAGVFDLFVRRSPVCGFSRWLWYIKNKGKKKKLFVPNFRFLFPRISPSRRAYSDGLSVIGIVLIPRLSSQKRLWTDFRKIRTRAKFRKA